MMRLLVFTDDLLASDRSCGRAMAVKSLLHNIRLVVALSGAERRCQFCPGHNQGKNQLDSGSIRQVSLQYWESSLRPQALPGNMSVTLLVDVKYTICLHASMSHERPHAASAVPQPV